MLAILAVLIFFMFRNSRKRQAEQREQQSKVLPGARVMTNFGLYGTIIAIDEDENQVELEVAPGTVLTVHRQTIARVVDPVDAVTDTEAGDEAVELNTAPESEPEFGERIESSADEKPDTKKSDD
ncbi:preprotein translocase subunit YajC [Agromyces sp. LHK192]|uniref:preprotein translocase subunit YajC n=1 Tax=Agromyces sp. LHK192 TaxID=2498704 RepID=UPI001F0CD762|nr:preprotein translocase subunit YajC [Agromyces sp. LHK192]